MVRLAQMCHERDMDLYGKIQETDVCPRTSCAVIGQSDSDPHLRTGGVSNSRTVAAVVSVGDDVWQRVKVHDSRSHEVDSMIRSELLIYITLVHS